MADKARTRYTKEYRCTNCGAQVDDRDKLTVKKVSFHGMGARARTFKSRVVSWLCPDCLSKDVGWSLPSYTDPAELGAALAAAAAAPPPTTPGHEQLTIPTT